MKKIDGYVRVSLFLFSLVLPGGGWAGGDVAFSASVDRTSLSMNDTLMLELSLSGERMSLPQPSLPQVDGFRVTYAGQSQNINYVNGKVSSEVRFSYALAPQAAGPHTIPAVTISIDGKSYSTQPIPVTVTSQGAGAAPEAVGSSVQPGGRPSPKSEGRPLFVTTTISDPSPYVGEQITLLFRFYNRVPLLSQPNYNPPSTEGFLSEDLPPQRNYVETLGGVRYQVIELATALFATSQGRFTIGPAELTCQVQSADPFGGDDFFQGFFQRGRAVTLRSDPILVRVRPLPSAGKPAGFRGDVGRYAFSAAVDTPSVRVNEPVTLTLTVSGQGNIKTLSAPPLPTLRGLKSYETLSSLNVEKKDGRVRGSKVFTTVLKPEVSGDLALPKMEFSYFDPEAGAYKTAVSAPLSLRVEQGKETEGVVSFSAAAPEGVKEFGRDIRFIKTRGPLETHRRPWYERGWFLGAQAVPGGIFLFIALGRAWNRHGRRRWAPSASRRALKALAKVSTRDPDVAALHRIFLDYLGAKCGASALGLTFDVVEQQLRSHTARPETLAKARSLWNAFDQARFAGGSGGDLKTLLNDFIIDLEAK